jgi:hypothetical protein
MVSCLSGMYLLSFCLIGLNAGPISNLCSITSHVKTSIFFWRKVMRHWVELCAEAKLLICVIGVYSYFHVSSAFLLVIHRLIGTGLV